MGKVNRIEYKCPDGVTRIFDSQSEINFIEMCQKTGVKILKYNTNKSIKFELFDEPPMSIKSPKLEKLLKKWELAYDVNRMRKIEKSFKSWDFHIEIDGQEFLCEVKGAFTNKNEMSKDERAFYTSWAMVKSIMASKYKIPFIIFEEKTIKEYGFPTTYFDVEYYLPETLKEWNEK